MSKSVLILDDEKDLLDVMVDYLEEDGVQCWVASSVEQGLSLVSKSVEKRMNYDLIISDMRMPDGTGLDFFQAVRKKGVQTPFLFLSGEDLDNEIKSYRKEGVLGWIAKPFRGANFLERIREVLKATA